MGESLIYSWLRHEKQCKVVQTNWKVSPNWNLMHKNDLDKVMYEVETHFKTSYCHSCRTLNQYPHLFAIHDKLFYPVAIVINIK